jgi:hypothetical protein
MKRSALSGPAVLILVPALLVSGCGGGSKSSDKPTSKSTSSASASITPSPTPTPTDPAASLVPLTGNGFSIKLPHAAQSSPETFDTSAGKVKTTVYSDVDDTGGFVVAMAAYPNRATVNLPGAVKGVAKNFNGTVAVDAAIQVQGYPARQVRIDNGSTGGTPITIYLLAVNVHNQLFQLQYVLKGPAPATAPAILNTVASTVSFG